MVSPLASGPSKTGGTRAVLRRLEVALYCAGAALVGLFLVVRVDAALGRRAALEEFEAARGPAVLSAQERPSARGSRLLVASESPDQSMWSPERVRGFDASLTQHFAAAPLAILRIPGIDLEVPVLAGTDELALNRGVGHIEGTPRPGQAGNVGIAGHRDGFFRGLKDVSAGDPIEIESLGGTGRYRIESITIVSPDRVDVLAATASPTVTLVTCFPFYYVGSAPKRYIVHAVLDEPGVLKVAERRVGAP
jgi:sortase A